MKKVNSYIDHTLLKPDATSHDIYNLCEEAIENNFKSVCVNPSFVKQVAQKLHNQSVKVCSVASFPLGVCSTKTKKLEVENMINDGANEVDMVANIGLLKEKKYSEYEKDIYEIVKITQAKNILLKVIIETALLSNEEIATATQIIEKTGAEYIKTSTGFSTRGASLEDINIMKNNIKNSLKIKASGGIKNYKQAKAYLDLGVSRLGTSSGIQISQEESK